MISKVHEKVFAESLVNGDIENVYVFNIYNGDITLIADLESIGTDIAVNMETMRFNFPEELLNRGVGCASLSVRSHYSGGIEAEPYKDENNAISDLMNLYEGLICRYYLISSEVTIADLSLLPDGIAYIYIEEEYDE